MKCTITRASAEARPPLIQRQLSPRPRPGPRQFCHDRPEHAPEAGFLIFDVLSSDVLRTRVWSKKLRAKSKQRTSKALGLASLCRNPEDSKKVEHANTPDAKRRPRKARHVSAGKEGGTKSSPGGTAHWLRHRLLASVRKVGRQERLHHDLVGLHADRDNGQQGIFRRLQLLRLPLLNHGEVSRAGVKH